MTNKEAEKLREESISEFRKQTRSHTIDNRGLDIPITVDERDLLVDIAIQKAREEKDKEADDKCIGFIEMIKIKDKQIAKLKAEIKDEKRKHMEFVWKVNDREIKYDKQIPKLILR